MSTCAITYVHLLLLFIRNCSKKLREYIYVFSINIYCYILVFFFLKFYVLRSKETHVYCSLIKKLDFSNESHLLKLIKSNNDLETHTQNIYYTYHLSF